MKLQCCVRINSKPLSGKQYYFVKDGIGGISVLMDGERIGYVDGMAAECLKAEEALAFFAAACRVQPVIRMGNYAIFKIMGIGSRIFAALSRVRTNSRQIQQQEICTHTVAYRRYPAKMPDRQSSRYMQYD